jgi:hypothetical protein
MSLVVVLAAPACAEESPALSCASNAPVRVASAAVFGVVRIDNEDVFDPDDPAEDGRLYRLANTLHVRTHPEVIEHNLLFRPGDPYSERVLHESERLLRKAGYLYDPRICVIAYHDNIVDVGVETRDEWTLSPGVSFGRGGGVNTASLSIEDENLLGTGLSVEAGFEREVDRDSTFLEFSGTNLFGRWITLSTTLADNSDGHRVGFTLEQPFHAIDVRRARGIRFLDDDRIDSLYDRGEVVDEFRHETSYQRALWGWSPGLAHGWARRWTVGLVRDVHRYSPADAPAATTLLPSDRELQYPFFGFELLRDRFVTASNHDQMNRTEDFYLGPRVYAELGVLEQALGSDRSGVVFDSGWSLGAQPGEAAKWLAQASWSGRVEESLGLADSVAGGRFSYYLRQSPRRLLFASVQADIAYALDVDHQLLLGGDNGLRGYPLRYAGGDRRALFTVEQRYFTSWYPFRLFHVAGAAFFDVGRAWGDNPFAEKDPGWLEDVGVGLRIGSSRSGGGSMVHVDLAFPLDGGSDIDDVQLVIETKHGF